MGDVSRLKPHFGRGIQARDVGTRGADPGAKTIVGSRWRGSSEAAIRLAKWRQDHRTGLTVAGFAVTILGTAWLVRAGSGGGTESPNAAPAPHSGAVAAPGARLVVHTPRGEPGRLRAGPGLSAAVLGYIPAGTEVLVIGITSLAAQRWYQIRTPKGDGWMHAAILREAA